MELLTALIGLMDDALLTILGAPVLGVLLFGSLVLSCLGLFQMLQDVAGNRNRKK